jgi:glycosyltransferase involved in cell wall biosynthesis
MLFSVVIPTYNRLKLLQRTLASVRRQSHADYEIIVVDDGSTDATREWLASNSGSIRVVQESNRGPGAARNVGAREARGKYVAFLDSDDLWFPWTLEVFARAIREHGYPNIVGGKFVEFRDEPELLAIPEAAYETLWFSDYISSSRYPYSIGSGTCVLRREGFAKVKFLEDRLNAEDHDLILRMGALPGFVRILAPITLAWRRHPASETGDFARAISGAFRLLSRESAGVYPGGSERARDRHRILARHTRPIALACVRKGLLGEGWNLYWSTFTWNVQFGRCKYLLGFLSLAVLALLSRAMSRKPRRA